MVIADNVAIHVNEIFVDGAPLDNLGLYGGGPWHLEFKSIATFQRILILQLVPLCYLGFDYPKTSIPPMPQNHLRISGDVGTSHFQRG